MLSKRSLLFLPLLAAPLVIAACDDSGSTGPADGAARVSLLLTDAPGDLEAAVVTITDIYLQGGGGEDDGRVYLRQGDPVTTDLLSLSNDVVEIVDDYEIPAGNYSQLRFVISGAYLEVENEEGGTTIYATSPDYEGLPAGVEADGDLQCPSCAQSGFKVLLGPLNGNDDEDWEGEVMFDGEQTILVDFDVSRSFGHEAGNSGKWVMRPTLKATRLVSAGSVNVTLALNDTTVKLPLLDSVPVTLGSFSTTLTPVAGGEAKTLVLADTDADGIYEATFGFLFPGDYNVGLVGLPGLSFLTDLALPVVVSVEEGSDATVALKLTGASVEEAPAE